MVPSSTQTHCETGETSIVTILSSTLKPKMAASMTPGIDMALDEIISDVSIFKTSSLRHHEKLSWLSMHWRPKGGRREW